MSGPAFAAVVSSHPETAETGVFASLLKDAEVGIALMARQMAQPAPDAVRLVWLLLTLALAYGIVRPAREWAIRRLSAFLARGQRHSDLTVFGRALGAVIITLVTFSIGSAAVLNAVSSCLMLLPEMQALVGVVTTGCVLSGLGLGIGRALRSPDAKELRPVQLPPGLGQTIAIYPFAGGILLGAVSFVDSASRMLHASASSWGVAQGIVALAQLLLIGRFLVLAGQARERSTLTVAGDEKPRLPAVFGLTAIVWSIIAVAAVALLLGHARFAMTVLQEILWAALVLTTTWIITRFLDALVVQLLSQNQRTTRFATGVVGVQKMRIDQAALLMSAVMNVVIWLIALLLTIAPLHGRGDNVVEQVRPKPMLASLRYIDLTPGTIFTAVMILAGGIAATRMIRGWLERRFLPATTLDIAARTSITTGLGYIGVIFALVGASSALGLQLEKVTLIASALTVGIGFGLQAIIQNFVSGIIMLFERPVKIGDRVLVSGSEGRIRKMRVRATELVADDGSVAIIPNSAFISSIVVNKSEVAAPTELSLKIIVTGIASARAAKDLLQGILGASEVGGGNPSARIDLEKIGDHEFVFQVHVRPNGGKVTPDVRSRLLMELSEKSLDGVSITSE
ncbi:mechanosensitive ion channel [Sphingomonas sanguinis]|uniref:mechanosensitive ion channel family protein n=1 Tax=Sphingomonas sanguinis TaxID=33051 RepID=UPI001C56DCE4|nr:mechanosensitive ion channel domain-containing protein [Sphingomonas sanguinis]QXT34841.1 mechanosensitive ion channel [Sphingomonas sanguinis]